MGMLVKQDHLGFGMHSWRHAMEVDDDMITHCFEEPGINDLGTREDPYGQTAPEHSVSALAGPARAIGMEDLTRV